ncbi:MAG: iron-sulfur cluster-binding domain-containing protein [Pedobacter sp.]|nr:MAG: iron-sulfur cluster-binding domain-containing protein [Pedobacter sp.]
MPVLIVKQVIQETEDARTYVVEDTSGEKIIYKAGQFITFTINRNGRELRRSYSLNSSPGFDEHVCFTVKLVPNGEISRYLFNSVTEGSTFVAQAPSGRFVFDAVPDPLVPEKKRDIYLVAAGSGVTPVFSLLKQMVGLDNERLHIKLVLQNRSASSAIFHKEFVSLADRFGARMDFYDFLSAPVLLHTSTDGHLQHQAGTIAGRINNEIFEELINNSLRFDRADALFYICGPVSFMRMAEFTVRQMGFGAGQVKKEIFEVPVISHVGFTVDDTVRSVAVRVDGEERVIGVQFPQSILDAALANGIDIPYSCKAGICGSCAVRCRSGKVRMRSNDVLTDAEVGGGLILTCTGYAESDLVLEV